MSTERLRAIFVETLEIPVEDVVDTLEYAKHPQWDSVAHMALVAAIDEGFDIMMETDDILAMSTFGIAKKILQKYGAEF